MNQEIKSVKTGGDSYILKGVLIFVLSVVLLIITIRISFLVDEREQLQNETITSISKEWGGFQELKGPILTIPYTQKVFLKNDKDGNPIYKPKEGKLHILPEYLNIDTQMNTSTRKRNIYQSIVYGSKTKINGYFAKFAPNDYNLKIDELELSKAYLSFGISELKGISDQVLLNFNKNKYIMNPGSIDVANSQALTTKVELKSDKNMIFQNNFDLKIDLNGSQGLFFAPVGKETIVKVDADWKDPSFSGEFLPKNRKVTDNGFNADWKILHLNRNYPQIWKDDKFKIDQATFGVNLIDPVSHYLKTERSVKYAILVIGLTFLTFFLVEIINKKYVHPFQYTLVGLAIVIFYILLLSISEHLNFTISFLTSSIMTIALVSIYSWNVLKSRNLALMLTFILTGMYGFIFILIQEQKYSLLFGSIGLFVILSAIMYFTRKIDWHKISFSKKS